MSFKLPSFQSIADTIGVFTGSGKAGSLGAGAAAASVTSRVQSDVLNVYNRLGKFLGPILGNSGLQAFSQGAGQGASAAQARVSSSLSDTLKGVFGGYSPTTILALGGGAVVLGYLVWTKRR